MANVQRPAEKHLNRQHETAEGHVVGAGPHLGPEEYWHVALAEGRFLLQRSCSSGKTVFPPRAMEPGSGARDLEWIEAKEGGTVYACTVVYPPAPKSPYNVVLVDLEEGARIMGRVDDIPPELVCIGLRVRAEIVSEEGNAFVVFRAA